MPRFYYFFESADTEAPLVLPPEAVHHAMRVLRMRQGDAVEVFNGKGCAVKGTIRFATDFAEVIPQEVIMQPRGLKLVLMQALVANEKMDWIIEKACELGYAEIAVFPSERGEVRLTCEKAVKRVERWNKIAVSACSTMRRKLSSEYSVLQQFERCRSSHRRLEIRPEPDRKDLRFS